MKVVVVGSAGYMGRHLMRTLSAAGIQAIGASTSDGSGIDPDSGLLPADFKLQAGSTVVVYMAQSPRYREGDQAHHVLTVNVVSAVRAAIAARAAAAARFIYVSTGTVYAPSFEPLAEAGPLSGTDWYSLSKIHGEQAVRRFDSDMEVIVVRPFGIYGPGQLGRLVPNLIASICNGNPLVLQGREGAPHDIDGLRISLCHIDDATNILLHLIQKGGPPTLNLAGDEAPSIRTISTLLSDKLGRAAAFAPATANRNFDLIADLTLLSKQMPLAFTALDEGLSTVVDALEAGGC